MKCNHLWKVAHAYVVNDGRLEAVEHGYIVYGSVYCTRCGASGDFAGKGVATNAV